MRSSPRLRHLLALFAVALFGALPCTSSAQPPAQDLIGRYRIKGVVTREQRSAIATAGAAIDAVGPDWVDISATAADLRRIAGLGLTVSLLAHPSDESHIDPAYHTYDEMVAEISQVAAAH